MRFAVAVLGIAMLAVSLQASADILYPNAIQFRALPPQAPEIHYSDLHDATFKALKVYERVPGCSRLAALTGRWAWRRGLNPKLVASMIVTESTCNPLAVSSAGALGVMQIVPKYWSNRYDFTRLNLLNPETNIEIGTELIAKL